jgi:hypothetical protein
MTQPPYNPDTHTFSTPGRRFAWRPRDKDFVWECSIKGDVICDAGYRIYRSFTGPTWTVMYGCTRIAVVPDFDAAMGAAENHFDATNTPKAAPPTSGPTWDIHSFR